MYAMCIVRAVNGLVEPSQQSYYAESVMSIATKIGLPAWFVDLRHDSTHNTLPTINILRSAARSLLLWYRENYWEQQNIYLENLSYRCLHYDPNNNSPEIIENSNQFDVLFARESTFLANILLPLFHEDILNAVHSLHDHCNDLTYSSENIMNYLTQYKREIWELLIIKALVSHKGAFHMILTSIFSTAVSDIRCGNESHSPIKMVYYSVLNWWARFLYERYLELGNSNNIQLIPSPLFCVWERFKSLPLNQQQQLMTMKEIVENLYNISSFNSSSKVDSELVQENDSISSITSKRNLDSIPGPGNSKLLKRRRMWPLGNRIGELSSNYLYLLEEISSS